MAVLHPMLQGCGEQGVLGHAAARAGCRAHHELIGFSISSGRAAVPSTTGMAGQDPEPQHSRALPAAEGSINPCLCKPIDLGWHGIQSPLMLHCWSVATGPVHPWLPLLHLAPCSRLISLQGEGPWIWRDPVPGCPRALRCSSAPGDAVGSTGKNALEATYSHPWSRSWSGSSPALPDPSCAMEIWSCGAAAAPWRLSHATT